MNKPQLLTPIGSDTPLWGECSACRAKFSPKDTEKPRSGQEADMQGDFLKHLDKVHGSEDFSQTAARIVREATEGR